MQYNLAIDSGGTKVLALLYDDKFRPLRSCRVGSMRENTTPADIIQRNIDELLHWLDMDGGTINCLTGIISSTLVEQLRARCTIVQTKQVGELTMGLYAAEIFGDGCLAIAGTGATLCIQHGERIETAGGYGSTIADEGSGYWIGREAFLAAIHDYENRGEHTILTDLIAEQMGGSRETLRKRIFSTVYDRQSNISPVMHVANCAPLVTQAAYAGDAIACDILSRAGTLLAEQLAGLIQRTGVPADLPIVLAGSVWRSHPILLTTFRQILQQKGIRGEIRVPFFEPIAGAVLSHFISEKGTFTADDHAYFTAHYGAYAFRFDPSIQL